MRNPFFWTCAEGTALVLNVSTDGFSAEERVSRYRIDVRLAQRVETAVFTSLHLAALVGMQSYFARACEARSSKQWLAFAALGVVWGTTLGGCRYAGRVCSTLAGSGRPLPAGCTALDSGDPVEAAEAASRPRPGFRAPALRHHDRVAVCAAALGAATCLIGNRDCFICSHAVIGGAADAWDDVPRGAMQATIVGLGGIVAGDGRFIFGGSGRGCRGGALAVASTGASVGSCPPRTQEREPLGGDCVAARAPRRCCSFLPAWYSSEDSRCNGTAARSAPWSFLPLWQAPRPMPSTSGCCSSWRRTRWPRCNGLSPW